MLRPGKFLLQESKKKGATAFLKQFSKHERIKKETLKAKEAYDAKYSIGSGKKGFDFNENIDRQRERVRKNVEQINKEKHEKLGDKSKSFKYKTEAKKTDYFHDYYDKVFESKDRNRIKKGVRNLYGSSDPSWYMQNNLRPISPLDDKDLWVDGAKWVEMPKSKFNDGRSYKIVNAGRALCLGNDCQLLTVGGGLTGQALTYCYHYWNDKKGAISSELGNMVDLKKGGYKSDIAQTYGRPTRTPYGRLTHINFEMDPNYTESSTSYALGIQRTAYTNPALVRMAIESKEVLRKLRFHLSILGDDAPDIHFEPVGSLWIARKSEGDIKKAKLMNAHNHARDAQMKYGEIGKFTAMLLGPERLKTMFPWMNTDDVELAVYGLENEGTYNVQALHRYLMHKNRQYGHKYYHGEFVGVKKMATDDIGMKEFAGEGRHKYPTNIELGDEVTGIDDSRGPQSKVLSAYFKIPSQEEPVEVIEW